MRWTDALYEFACGGVLGWMVRDIAARRAERAANSARSGEETS